MTPVKHIFKTATTTTTTTTPHSNNTDQKTVFNTFPHPPSLPINGTLSGSQVAFALGTVPSARYARTCFSVHNDGAVMVPCPTPFTVTSPEPGKSAAVFWAAWRGDVGSIALARKRIGGGSWVLLEDLGIVPRNLSKVHRKEGMGTLTVELLTLRRFNI